MVSHCEAINNMAYHPAEDKARDGLGVGMRWEVGLKRRQENNIDVVGWTTPAIIKSVCLRYIETRGAPDHSSPLIKESRTQNPPLDHESGQ